MFIDSKSGILHLSLIYDSNNMDKIKSNEFV